MVSAKLKLHRFYFNGRDIQKQSFIGVEAAVRTCFSKQVFSKSSQYSHLRWSILLITFTAKQCFPENIEKFLRTGVFIEYLRWLLLQVLCKKAAPKNFANFTRTYRYRNPFYQVAGL